MKPLILFVDDESNVLEGLRRALHTQTEWEKAFCTTAREAVDIVRRKRVSTVVTDVRMPAMDGLTLLQTLRNDPATHDLPVLILTGSGERDLKRRALDMDATDLLVKPVDPEDLIARISSCLRLKAYQDQIKEHNRELERKVRDRTTQLEGSRMDMIWRLARVAEYHDQETGEHVARVGLYSRAIAQVMQMPEAFAETLMLTAPLHDIGKVGVPDSILLKAGRLTDTERRIMQRHCAIGAEMLRRDLPVRRVFLQWQAPHAECANPLLHMAGNIAMAHHERWDGQGYPARLAGNEIPLEARIAGVADVFDALGSDRPYKPAYDDDETLAIMRGERAQHFDPAVFDAFEEALPELRTIRATLSENVVEAIAL